MARLIEIADDAWRESDTRRLLAALKHLLGPCPATAQRAAAAKAYATTARSDQNRKRAHDRPRPLQAR